VPLRVSAILATVALAVVAAGMSNGAPTAFPGKPGRIAYNVAASGMGAWISTISPDGSRVRRLITTRADAFSPSWSADGRRIVFVIGSSIWRVNGDGHRLTRITWGNIVDPESPAWSPDGTRVAFAARTSGQNFDIYVVNTNGKALRRLTTSPSADEHPSWSPDSKRITFTHNVPASRHPLTAELWTMNADGSHQRRIGFGSAADWAPDGKRIAFVRGPELWVANADGSKPARVIAGPGMAGDPAWSPDGRWIAFWSDRASDEATKGDLYLATVDGKIVERLTYEPELWHFAPTWQPLGRRTG
jgi:TolB protein